MDDQQIKNVSCTLACTQVR